MNGDGEVEEKGNINNSSPLRNEGQKERKSAGTQQRLGER
jgi:hypothetical protein